MAIQALIPIYILVFVGFSLIRSGYLPKDAVFPANLFVVKVLVPVLIFLALFRASQNSDFNWKFITGYAVASLSVMFLGIAFLKSFTGYSYSKSSLFSLGGAGSNSIFIGLPLILMLFEDIAISSLSWVLLVENLTIIPLGLLLHDVLNQNQGKHYEAVLKLFKNPIFVAMMLGILLPFFIDGIWEPLAISMEMIKNATGGISLILIGAMLAKAKLGGSMKTVIYLSFSKLFLHPFTVLVCFLILGISGDILTIGVIFGSVSTFGVFANFCEAENEGEIGASVFTFTTLVAPLTILLWLEIVKYIQYI